MLTLTYVSSATSLLSVTDLVGMLDEIRPKNDVRGLTGMLFYSGGNIIQALEGPDEVVEGIFGAIEADPRHRDVTVVHRGPIEERSFANWSMGFRNISEREIRDITTFQEFVRRPAGEGLGDEAAPAFDLLSRFRALHN